LIQKPSILKGFPVELLSQTGASITPADQWHSTSG
jgi:hypothetical protein